MEQAWGSDGHPPRSGARDFWEEYIEEDERVYLNVYRCVSLDRILAVDPIGDGYYSMPHLFVEFDTTDGPFTPLKISRLERAHPYRGMVELRPEAASRVHIFPDSLPGLLEVPPKQFDGTLGVETSLSEPGGEKLGNILARMAERREQAKSASNIPDTAESRLLSVRGPLAKRGPQRPDRSAFTRVVRVHPTQVAAADRDSLQLRLRGQRVRDGIRVAPRGVDAGAQSSAGSADAKAGLWCRSRRRRAADVPRGESVLRRGARRPRSRRARTVAAVNLGAEREECHGLRLEPARTRAADRRS